jgi:hypothetical protein
MKIIDNSKTNQVKMDINQYLVYIALSAQIFVQLYKLYAYIVVIYKVVQI